MCEANAYLLEDNESTLIMEAVETIEPQEEGLQLVSIFGEQKFLKARIHSLSLVDNKVYLKQNGGSRVARGCFVRSGGFVVLTIAGATGPQVTLLINPGGFKIARVLRAY